MAIKSGIFNSVNGDRRYKAEDFAKYFSTFISNGVFPNPSNGFQVIENRNMVVTIKAGQAWINGYYVTNDADYNLTIDVADGVLNRIDRVVLQLNFLNREIVPIVKKGAFASSPVAPALKRDADAYEIALADVYVGKGVLSISQANITDLRLNTELCGIVHGTVNQVDTTTIFNQYQSWLTQQKANYEHDFVSWTAAKKQEYDNWTIAQASSFSDWRDTQENDFNDWFASIRNILDGDVAANLQNQIDQLSTKVGNLEKTVTAHQAKNATKAHLAKNISLEDIDGLFTSLEVEGALKEAIEKANSAFTSASNGKQTVGNAITGVDPNVTIPAEPTFQDLASAIRQIKTGMKYASGTVTNTGVSKTFQYPNGTNYSSKSPYLEVIQDFGFTPRRIVIVQRSYYFPYITVYDSRIGSYKEIVTYLLNKEDGSSLTNENLKVIKLSSPAYVTSTGFLLPVGLHNESTEWYAYKD